MNAGKLDKLVTIQQPTAGTADAYGIQANTWSTFATVWASIRPLMGREAIYASQVNPTASHMVTIRYTPGVTSAMRIKYGSRYLNIQSVLNASERGVEMQIMASEQL